MSTPMRFFKMLYSILWTVALPFLFFNSRLRQGWQQRLTLNFPAGPFAVWIQAASVGEAYLALELIRTKPPKTAILITTCTAQGYEILQKNISDAYIQVAYFPFDLPYLMQKAIQKARPGLVMMLETEIWPGLMLVCKKNNIQMLTANARMSVKSFSHYLVFKSFLKKLSPQKILAISTVDQFRFTSLFPASQTELMPNIKFDRIQPQEMEPYTSNPLAEFFRPNPPLYVFASIREQEEKGIFQTVQELQDKSSRIIQVIVPRHAHRLPAWKKMLANEKYLLRSKLDSHIPLGSIVLWDTFGELNALYGLSRSVFVGGSLAPLGGQNFLEPLAQGVRPIIGPSWDNFLWVGQQIIEQNLVIQINSQQELAETMLRHKSSPRANIAKKLQKYIAHQKGGCQQVWQAIQNIKNEK